MYKLHGEIWMDDTTGDWDWELDSMKSRSEDVLAGQLETIERLNPSSGLTFKRHLKGGREGCGHLIKDNRAYAKCLILQKSM